MQRRCYTLCWCSLVQDRLMQESSKESQAKLLKRDFVVWHFEQFPCLPFAYVKGVCPCAPTYLPFFVGGAVMDGIISCKFFAKNCRGVSHTPWCGRKGKDGGEQSIVFPWMSPLSVRFVCVEGVCDTPLHFYHLFVGNTVMDGIISREFFAANCRGVSHTPWCGRIGNDGGEQIIVETLPQNAARFPCP